MIGTDLMFAGANNAFINKVGDTGWDDGILTSKEIFNLNLQNVILVVLSACESGLVKFQEMVYMVCSELSKRLV